MIINIKRLITKKYKGLLPKLSDDDKKLMEQTLVSTAKKKGCYDEKAKKQIKSLLEKL